MNHIDVVTKQLALVDYDGMFFDVNTQYCYCPYCQEKFDIYLLEKYGKQGLVDIFGTADHRQIDLSTIYRDFEKTILDHFPPYLEKMWKKERISRILDTGKTDKITLENDWRLLRCYMQNSQAEFPPSGNLKQYLDKQFGARQIGDVIDEKKQEFTQAVLRYHFHKYLESKYLAEILIAQFGSDDIKRRCCSDPKSMLLWVETQRFWCKSMAAMHARLKTIGRQAFAEKGRGGDFYTVANLGPVSTIDALNKRRVDGINLADWAKTSDMQMLEEMPQPGSLESGAIISNIFGFRWAMAAGTRVGTLLYQSTDDFAADLSNAEAAAGGGGAFIQAGTGAPESRRRWKKFFSDYANLWDNGESAACAGVLFWSDQVFYEFPEHFAVAKRLVHILSETQVPFDLIVEDSLAQLNRYDLVFAPMLRYLSDDQIAQLLEYARTGGNLVIIEPFGTEDQHARPRQGSVLPAIETKNGFQNAAYGQGRRFSA